MKAIKAMFFSMVSSFKFIVKPNVFDKYAGCVRERKRYRKNTNNEIEILPQINRISLTPTYPSCFVRKVAPDIPEWSSKMPKIKAPEPPISQFGAQKKVTIFCFGNTTNALRTSIQKPASWHIFQQIRLVKQKPNNENPTTQQAIKPIRT